MGAGSCSLTSWGRSVVSLLQPFYAWEFRHILELHVLNHSPGWVLVRAVYLQLGFGLLQEDLDLSTDWASALHVWPCIGQVLFFKLWQALIKLCGKSWVSEYQILWEKSGPGHFPSLGYCPGFLIPPPKVLGCRDGP